MVDSGRLAFLFPGQASQKAGMAAELLAQEAAARAVFHTANEVLGLDLAAICTTADDATLTRTEVAQPALLTTSVAWLRVLTARGLSPDLAAGHSLGEFAAWVAAGVMEFEAALRLVQRRGELMEAAGEMRPGGMVAVLRLADEMVAELCAQAREVGEVVVANYNSPGQVVVSGESVALTRMGELVEEANGRVIPLRVSGAFHSPLMAEAGAQFAALVAELPLADPAIPVVANATAEPVTTAAQARDVITRQMTSPVLWTASVGRMVAAGTTRFLEVGPGRVLTQLVERIAPTVQARAVGKPAALQTVIEEIGA
jgi:[acyl-carrier-protein] S-malonyltransferase